MTTAARTWSVALTAAGILDCGMAGYHFFLPAHMGWAGHFHGAPAIEWALYALNFSWSLIVLLSGALVLYAARLGPVRAGTFGRRFIFVVGLFWLVHGMYTWVHPLPMPAFLAALKYLLLAFPAMTAALHWWPLFASRSPEPA